VQCIHNSLITDQKVKNKTHKTESERQAISGNVSYIKYMVDKTAIICRKFVS